MPTEPEDIAKLARAAGLALSPERAAIVAKALEAFEPFLDSIAVVEVDAAEPPPFFDARW